jgi:hypothetical protein
MQAQRGARKIPFVQAHCAAEVSSSLAGAAGGLRFFSGPGMVRACHHHAHFHCPQLP